MLALWVKVRVKPGERERFLKAIEVDAWRNKFVGADPKDHNFFDVNLRALVEASFQQISTR